MSKEEEYELIKKLARFRANPKEIRVRLRRLDGRWLAVIQPAQWDISHGHVREHAASDVDPKKAVLLALQRASDSGMKGVDLSMGWTYEHPFGEAGVKQRVDNE